MSNELFEAIEKHDTPQVLALLAAGADPNARESEDSDWRALHQAVYELREGGKFEVVLALLERGADVNVVGGMEDDTPLMLAVWARHLAAVEALLKAGADPNVRNLEGNPPLRECVWEGDLTMASLLLNAGAAKTIDEWGWMRCYTALGMAASQLDLPMIKLLLDAGANLDALDDDYLRALDRLQPRAESDPEQWETAFKLLGGKPPPKP